MQRRIATVMLVLALAFTASAEVSVPSFFSDHMVLQREMPIAVWGWAADGEQVTVQLGGGTPVKTKAGKDGTWKLKLPEAKAGGPFALVIKGKNEIRINDVLIGEVWLCSGQSNMEWTVARSNDFPKEKAAAKDGLIRHIKIPKRPLAKPDAHIEGKWQVCTPDTVGNFTACGYFMARHLRKELKVPIGLINSSWGGTRIEPWTPPVGFDSVPALKNISEALKKSPPAAPKGRGGHQKPTMLYNGMIHALVGYSMRGTIWYQGESNHVEGMLYTEKKKALVNGWRKLWGIGEFPFNFVQIAPYQYGKEAPEVLARFWVAQSAALQIPNTGMVVTTDVGNTKNIHPTNKQAVGLRLALIALNKTYGKKDVVYSGPVFKEMKVEGNKIRVSFEHAAGLKSRDGKPLSWFQVLDKEAGWTDAEAKIDGETVVVSSPKVAKPVSVRFAWHKLAEPNLSNGAGLPAATFMAGGDQLHTDSPKK